MELHVAVNAGLRRDNVIAYLLRRLHPQPKPPEILVEDLAETHQRSSYFRTESYI